MSTHWVAADRGGEHGSSFLPYTFAVADSILGTGPDQVGAEVGPEGFTECRQGNCGEGHPWLKGNEGWFVCPPRAALG